MLSLHQDTMMASGCGLAISHTRKEDIYRRSRYCRGIKNRVGISGLKLGIYYSGILDWSFTPKYILTFADLVNNGTIPKIMLSMLINTIGN